MTLEQRVRRLERSCHLWRAGFVAVVLILVAACASNRSSDAGAGGAGSGGLASANSPADAEFAHLTVEQLTVRAQPGGPQVVLSADADRALVQVATSAAVSSGSIVADRNGANLFLVRRGKGMIGATLSVDEQSGTVNLRDADGKSKVIEPE